MVRPPLDRDSAQEAARLTMDAWTARDPEEFVKLLSNKPIWKDSDQVHVGRHEIWNSLQRKWSRTLHLRVCHTLQAHETNAITIAFETEWQDSIRGQWYRTTGKSRLRFDSKGLISSMDTEGDDEPISAAHRRLTVPVRGRSSGAGS